MLADMDEEALGNSTCYTADDYSSRVGGFTDFHYR